MVKTANELQQTSNKKKLAGRKDSAVAQKKVVKNVSKKSVSQNTSEQQQQQQQHREQQQSNKQQGIKKKVAQKKAEAAHKEAEKKLAEHVQQKEQMIDQEVRDDDNVQENAVQETGAPDKIVASAPQKRRRKPGAGAIIEIRKLQNSTAEQFPTQAFSRLVHEISNKACSDTANARSGANIPLRWEREAKELLKSATEAALTEMFMDANEMRVHGKRATVTLDDIKLAKKHAFGQVDFVQFRDYSVEAMKAREK